MSNTKFMRKTFFYNFMPTKVEEEAAAARNVPYQVSRFLVEINDFHGASPRYDLSNNPWQIRKTVPSGDIMSGNLVLSHEEMFEHVFRYWTLESVNQVVQGNKCLVDIIDYTEDNNNMNMSLNLNNLSSRLQLQAGNGYVKSGPNDTYHLGFSEVLRTRPIHPGDEIGLFWDFRSRNFGFKVLRRANK